MKNYEDCLIKNHEEKSWRKVIIMNVSELIKASQWFSWDLI